MAKQIDPGTLDLERRLGARLAPLGAGTKKMFGGTCFMLRGNMVAGTYQGGIIVRVGRAGEAAAATLPGAFPMVRRGRPMAGYWQAPAADLGADTLGRWLDLALAENARLPEKPAKP